MRQFRKAKSAWQKGGGCDARQLHSIRRRSQVPPCHTRFFVRCGFFSDESVTAVNRAKDCYNFCFSDGALKEGYGLVDYERFKGIRPSYVWLYKRYDIEKEMQDDRFVIVSEEGELYSCTANGSEPAVKFTGITFTSPPSFVNYRLYGTDVVLICSARRDVRLRRRKYSLPR